MGDTVRMSRCSCYPTSDDARDRRIAAGKLRVVDGKLFALSGRGPAFCGISCEEPTGSRGGLPFAELRPNNEHDSHYCGCQGWD